MLPALAGFAAKALLPSEKKIDKDKFFAKKKTTAIQKVDSDENSDVKSLIVKKKTISTNLLLPSPPEIKALPPAKNLTGKSGNLNNLFSKVNETLKRIIDSLKYNDNISKKEEQTKKENVKIEEKKEREKNLEKKTKGKKPEFNIKAPGDKFNIMKFFGNVLLGSLALAIFKNLEEIIETLKNVFAQVESFIKKLGEFFSPIWDGMKWIASGAANIIAKILGIPSDEADRNGLKKNVEEIAKKIPFLENLFKGIQNTIDSIRGSSDTTSQPQSGGSGGGITPGGEMPGANIPSSEQDLLLRLIIAEASGEGEVGMAAVARSVLNRAGLVQSGKKSPGTFNAKGGSITDIITARNQYQPYAQGKLSKPLSAGQKKAALNALALAQNTSIFKQKLLQEGLSDRQANVILASTGFRNYAAGAGVDTSQQVNEVVLKRHTFNTAGNTGLLVPRGAKIKATPVEKQQVSDTTAQRAAETAAAQTQVPSQQTAERTQKPSVSPSQQTATQTQATTSSTLSLPEQAAQITGTVPAVQPPAPTQAQVAPTQAPPAVSASVPQIMQQADYEVPGGASSSTILPIPIGGGSSPTVMSGGGTKMLPIGLSRQALLNSYYQTQLIGFLYKQG